MQLNELIPNITLLLRQNGTVLAKLIILGRKPGYQGNFCCRLYPQVRDGAMTNDKLHIGE